MNMTTTRFNPSSSLQFGTSPRPTAEQTKEILLQRLSDKGWADKLDRIEAMVMDFGGDPEILLMVEPSLHQQLLATVKNELGLKSHSSGHGNEFLHNGLKVGVWPNNPVYPFNTPKL